MPAAAGKNNNKPSSKNFKGLIGTATLMALLGGGYVSYKSSRVNSIALTNGDSDPLLSEYLQFIAKYGKIYKDEAEFKKRHEIFIKNYNFVTEFNSKPNEETEGIVLGINSFSDQE